MTPCIGSAQSCPRCGGRRIYREMDTHNGNLELRCFACSHTRYVDPDGMVIESHRAPDLRPNYAPPHNPDRRGVVPA